MRTLLILGYFLLVSVRWMTALDPTHRISQYGHTSWKIQDGYFDGQPASVTQTTDGYIWVGTANGVFRFDGVQFVSLTSLSREKLQVTDVHSLLGARDGSLWIATGDNLLRWANGRLTEYLAGHELNGILEDEKGTIWVTRSGSGPGTLPICRIDGDNVHCYSYGPGEGASLSAAVGLGEDTSGNLWIGHDTAVVRWRSRLSKIFWPEALRSHQGTSGAMTFAAAPDGSMWVGINTVGPGGGLQHITKDVMEPFEVAKLNGETLEVGALLFDRQGNLWVGTSNQGLYRIHGSDVDHFGSADGLSADFVNQVFEDREGNLWCATSNGVDMLRDLRVITYSTRQGINADAVESVLAGRDGTVWIGSNRLQALVQGRISPELGKELPGNFVTAMLEDHTGRLWVGMNNKLWIHEGGNTNGTFRQITRRDGRPLGTVRDLAEDSEQNIWVQTNGPPATLLRLHDLNIQEEFTAPPLPRAFKLAPDPQSGIWLGLAKGGLARLRAGKIDIVGFSGRFDVPIQALFAAPDGSILGATSLGIRGWKNGKQQTLTVRNGLPCDQVYALDADEKGDLWLYAACGLIEIPNADIQRWWQAPESKLRFRLFDALDGVQAGLSDFSGSSKGPDGRLWFANNDVAQTIDPAHLTGNTVPPPVHINSVVADRKNYPLQDALKLPAVTRDLEIDYTALSFTAPKKVLFRYMLEGHDKVWQEPGTRRQAFYNDLRPRHYRFRVIACNNDGVWNETGAAIDFSILPAYYQTVWFKMLCAAAFLALLGALYLFRLQQLRHQFAIGLEAQVGERTRIARELHDTMLQSFQGLLLRFQTVSNLLPARADEAKTRIDSVIEEGSKAITEGRDAVHELRSMRLKTVDLAESIRNFARELLGNVSCENPPEFFVQVEGTSRELNPVVRDELYRIAAEALRNAIRHAAARRIEVEVRYDPDILKIRIRDDGKGIDMAVLDKEHTPGHWGLRGMRERASLIGESFEIWSNLGSGTEIELKILSMNAYAKRSSTRGRFLRRTSRA